MSGNCISREASNCSFSWVLALTSLVHPVLDGGLTETGWVGDAGKDDGIDENQFQILWKFQESCPSTHTLSWWFVCDELQHINEDIKSL